MTIAQPIKTNFTAGELSPRLMGRTDINKYANGAEKIENAYCLVAGGVTRRSGTRYVTSRVGFVRLIDFEFNAEQAYVLLFEDKQVTFCHDGGEIYAADAGSLQFVNGGFATDLAGWTVSNATWVTGKARLAAAGYVEQRLTVPAALAEFSMRFDVAGMPGDSVRLTVGTTSGGSDVVASSEFTTGYHVRTVKPAGHTTLYVRFSYGDGVCDLDNVRILSDEVVSLGSPYAVDDLEQVKTASSYDVMYMAHRGYRPHKLERYGHADWSLREVEFTDGPYGPKNLDSTWTLKPAAKTGNAVSIVAAGDKNTPFTADMVGRHIALKHFRTTTQQDQDVNPWGFGVIVGYVSPTEVTVKVMRDFLLAGTDANAATDGWMIGAWDDELGYPGAVTLFEERLWFGGSATYPQTVWGSKSNDWENFGMGANATDGITYTVSSDRVNICEWLSPGKTLIMGTAGAECIVRASDSTEAIAPDNLIIRMETSYGSSSIPPLRIDQVVLFPQRSKCKLREFIYSFEIDGWTSTDLGILSEHILRKGFRGMAYAQEPHSMVWVPTNDGVLAALTYQRSQDVISWSRQLLGGRTASHDHGFVESVATVHAGTYSQLWLSVQRQVNGKTVRHIEYLENEFWADDPQADKRKAYFLDSHLEYSGPATSRVYGLDHLIGETVGILSEGNVEAETVVKVDELGRGYVDLSYPTMQVVVGLPYVTKIRTVRFDYGNPLGTAQGKNSRMTRVTVRFFQTLGGWIGFDDDTMSELSFRTMDDPMDSSPPLYTGDYSLAVKKGYGTSVQVQVEQRQPLPMTILAVMPEYEVLP